MMYELLYILPTRYTDTEVEGIQAKVKGLVEKSGAKVMKEDNLGRIRLAYPIKQIRHGSYILSYFEVAPTGEEWSESKTVAEVDNQLRLAEEVLRHMIIQLPKGIPERSFDLESYVAPLSEEDEENRHAARHAETPVKVAVAAKVPETEPVARDEKPLSMEELDKKLDEILDVNISENI